MRTRAFMQVDVFSETAYRGNPLAVVLDSEGLGDEAMQAFARWTNLSETTFLLPPTPEGRAQGADYRVRIFTPGGELPFAGHPTLGSCHAWLAAGGQPQQAGRVVQECAKGLVPLQQDARSGRLAFAAPSLSRSEIADAELAPVLQATGLQAGQVLARQKLNNGPEFWALLLDDPDTILAMQPDLTALHGLGMELAVAALYPQAGKTLIGRASREARAFDSASGQAPRAAEADVEVRVWFNAGTSLSEDPITGSLNASLAQWLLADGHLQAPYVASQGINLDRSGIVNIAQDAAGQVWVGGHVSAGIRGEVLL
ncbi:MULTISPECIES: PhzF family phenazine biosynthesis protein [unclassified Comamonas]|uniref:PhzF family phenazine biosynthesis protein n=1 Tax=unclassified Comamonas TaxID=2638500 RepID=UPI00289C5B39|nr:PhzF family phenazine biosynthesis protein [Comamonas sp.]